MSGRLRSLGQNPIADRERQRLFWLLAAVVVAAAVLLLVTRPSKPNAGRIQPAHATRSTESAAQAVLTRPAVSSVPPASAAPVRAAQAFLTGYLPLLYGQTTHAHLVDATPGLSRALAASEVVVPPAQVRRRPRVLSTTATRSGHAWQVRAVIDDGGVADYPIVLDLTHGRSGRWLVSEVRG